MTQREKIKFLILRSIGNFLVLFAIYGVFATFGPVLYYEVKFKIIQARGIEYKVADQSSITIEESPTSLGQVLAGKKEQILIAKDTQFSILIPKIGAQARIFPNVDPGNAQEFLPVLREGVAHAKGTVFPGMNGNIYLFAHSTDNWWNVGRYNAVFYLIKELSPNDEIVLFFENRRYNFRVTKSMITDPSEVSYLVDSQTGPQRLILQTCWPPGTTLLRYFVIAEPQAE